MGEIYNAAWVQAQVDRTIDLWRASAAVQPERGAAYSLRDHEAREISYDAEFQTVEWEARSAARSNADGALVQGRVVAAFARFAANALDLDPDTIGLLTEGFLPAGIEFAQRAREFDAHISRADTIQGCRNAWTAFGLQPLLGEPSRITPSILAYSLLYPYSDNYLDAEDVPKQAKLAFSRRFRDRLRGWDGPALNARESAIWALVGLIEEQFAREDYPDVFDCLLAIHQAQEDSIAQLGALSGGNDAEVLQLSIAKGGTSVLVDACLARGSMRAEESRAAFEWGALLQLGDDLQDVHDDLRRGSATFFTRAIRQGQPLDSLVLQLLALCDQVAVHMDGLAHGSQLLKDLLRMSWRSLIIAAVAEAHEFFTPGFIVEIEQLSPFRFGFLRARRQKLVARNGIFSKLFDLFVEQLPADGRNSPVRLHTSPSCFEPAL